jgi:uncharacterized protein (DUF952 family)
VAAAEHLVPGPVTATIYKIVPEALWRAAQADGVFRGSPVDVADGFIHFSTAAQVAATAARHFRDIDGLVIVSIATNGLDLRWEPSRGGDLFPHLYAELPMASVRWVKPLPIAAGGGHVLPALD